MNSSSREDMDLSETANFISQILMEETVDQSPFFDSLTLQLTEKSFYDALSGNHGGNNSNYREFNTRSANSASQPTVRDGVSDLDSSIAKLLAHNIFNDVDSVSQFRRGLEEATKFLPPGPNLVTALHSYGEQPIIITSEENSYGLNLKSRKNNGWEKEERRSKKQSALSLVDDESDLSDAFDRMLLNEKSLWNKEPCLRIEAAEEKVEGDRGKGGLKKRGRKKKAVDLRNLLLMCSDCVYANDIRGANDLLKQIRQHSSPSGDASERVAHYFANGLMARLLGDDGTDPRGMYFLVTSKTPVSELLKVYHFFTSSMPHKKFLHFFANEMIMKIAAKAETLHIIDFGIQHGFQWPMLIKFLSNREGGPPKLKITGIEFPQPGFRPTEKIEETGHRLANYCKRYNVPFEYNAIASWSWETIKVEALKIQSKEIVAVNCHIRFEHLLDESTIEVNNPRNAVLHLIRKINPDVFIPSITNGSYNAPFFASRFREALFHYSASYDRFDAVIPRENDWRMLFEREFLGREIMNVVACEGSERIERPETYKQWQVRIMRASFKKLPLNEELMAKFRSKLKEYHTDFVLDENSNWMLQDISAWFRVLISLVWWPSSAVMNIVPSSASNELVAVNCHMRFENVLDESIEVNSPRNAILHLIRKMNPVIFTHSITNVSYNAPFLATRFREALFHYSATYDMIDTVIPRENDKRLMIEGEFLGREIMNVIACEGSERIERPETYRQWQVRNTRAGFKQLPLNEELMAKFRTKLKEWYHKDFVLDEDNNWMLQGWNGRILYASTCWVPA